MRRSRLGTAVLVTVAFAGAAALVVPSTGHADPVLPMNVVTVMADDMDAAALSEMPFVSTLPGMQWFTHAYNQVSLCCPARVQYLTGESTYHTGVENVGGPTDGRVFDDSSSLATWLQAAGYDTMLDGKYLNQYGVEFYPGGQAPPGWTRWIAFVGRPGYGVDNNPYTLTDGTTETPYSGNNPATYSTDVLAQAGERFIRDETVAGRPFYLQMMPYGPHDPHLAAPQDVGAHAKALVPHNASFREVDVSDKPAYIKALSKRTAATFDAIRRSRWDTLLSIDRAVHGLYDTLLSTGQLDHTVIIFTSDNGYGLGEHWWLHKKCPYEVCQRVPLGILYPGQPDATHRGLVRFMDLAPTIAAITGATPTIPIDGASFLPTLLGGPEPATRELEFHWIGSGKVVGENPPKFRGIRTSDGWKYVEYGTDVGGVTGERELYNLNTDPFELSNLHGKPGYAQTEAALAARLAAISRPLRKTQSNAIAPTDD